MLTSYFLAGFAAAFAALLTFFSGFGLGTLLLAVYLLIFPPTTAVAATALVHLANNLFKLAIVVKHARIDVVLRFGLPALFAAAAGAYLLGFLADLKPVFTYVLLGKSFQIMPLKLVIGILMAGFALLDLSRLAEKWVIAPEFMPLGGMLSGFFGGLSGHQGAFRTMFLIKAGLSKEEFIGTGSAIAVMVDLGRLTLYLQQLNSLDLKPYSTLLIVSTLAALLGTILGAKLLKKVSIRAIEFLASILLIVISISVSAGLI